MTIAEAFCGERGWSFEAIDEAHAVLGRVVNEEDVEYSGPTRGLAIQPHENSDPLRLEFDQDLFIQEYVKTQFCPVNVHLSICELLRAIEPNFAGLSVMDEGEYFETANLEILEGHLQNCQQQLERLLAEHPNAQGPVRIQGGRIVDFIQ